LAAARAIPNLLTIRPADANEVVEAWRVIMPLKNRPVALVLTRQNLPTVDRSKYASAAGLARGGYVLAEGGPKPQMILMGTGSEVSLCVQAHEQLAAEGIQARVVSMPCWRLFDEQDEKYRESVLPSAVTARLAVETGVEQGWERYLGPRGRFIGMTGYGASAPAGALFKHFGFTVENVLAQAKAILAKK
jgi:transketolase